MLVEEDGQIVGFCVYGEFIPKHPNAFGMGIGRNYTRNGYGSAALREFIQRRGEFGVGQLNGYCHRDNAAIIGIMQKHGFRKDDAHRDPRDANAVKFSLSP